MRKEGELAPVGAFTGRDGLFYELETAVRQRRVILLQGPAGTGRRNSPRHLAAGGRTPAGGPAGMGILALLQTRPASSASTASSMRSAGRCSA